MSKSVVRLSDMEKEHWNAIDAALMPLEEAGLIQSTIFRLLDVSVTFLGRAETSVMLEAFLDEACDMQMQRANAEVGG